MSDLSPELNLALAVDDDDTADYLDAPTNSLRSSLLTLDGLFNATTGHAHNGSHQGGALQFQDLTVGRDLTVVGASDLRGPVHVHQNLTVDGASTLQSLTVNTTTHLVGAVTADAAVTAASLSVATDLSVGRDLGVTRNAVVYGTLAVGGLLTANAGLTVNGSVTINSGNLNVGSNQINAGLIYGIRLILNSYDSGNVLNVGGSGVASAYFYNRSGAGRCWDNVDFTFSQTNVAGTLVQRDGSGVISDPKVGGQTDIGGGTYTFPAVAGNAGMWRFVKAWGGNRVMYLTSGTLILWTVQYSSGQYTLANGDSLSCYCDGSNWWVL